MNEQMIIDITADQFKSLSKCDEGVYVGKENPFYKQLADIRMYDNYNIKQDTRLWNDYQIIRKYIS